MKLYMADWVTIIAGLSSLGYLCWRLIVKINQATDYYVRRAGTLRERKLDDLRR